MNKMDKKSGLFYCYDSNMSKFLRYEKDINFLTRAKHINTDKVFYLFLVTDALQEALNEYKQFAS